MSDPIVISPLPPVRLTMPRFETFEERVNRRFFPDLQLPLPNYNPPRLADSITSQPNSGIVNGGYSIASVLPNLLCLRLNPPVTPSAPLLQLPNFNVGNNSIGNGYHTNLPFGVDYMNSPDFSVPGTATNYHQFNIWLNKDISVGNFGILHQTGISNGFSAAGNSTDTQVSGWGASTTLVNWDFRSPLQRRNGRGIEWSMAQAGAGFDGSSLLRGRSYSISSQLEIHATDTWSLIINAAANFTPPYFDPDGRTGFNNITLNVIFLPTHFIIPAD